MDTVVVLVSSFESQYSWDVWRTQRPTRIWIFQHGGIKKKKGGYSQGFMGSLGFQGSSFVNFANRKGQEGPAQKKKGDILKGSWVVSPSQGRDPRYFHTKRDKKGAHIKEENNKKGGYYQGQVVAATSHGRVSRSLHTDRGQKRNHYCIGRLQRKWSISVWCAGVKRKSLVSPGRIRSTAEKSRPHLNLLRTWSARSKIWTIPTWPERQATNGAGKTRHAMHG